MDDRAGHFTPADLLRRATTLGVLVYAATL